MGFLSGSMTFECFRIDGSQPLQFGPEHVEILEEYAIDQTEGLSGEGARIGFLAGDHLLDNNFSLEKNIIGDALHCAVRIDTNQIPAAIRRAWLQIELAGVTAESPGRRPTKAQREEAKEAVQGQCEEAARGGQFIKMQQFPVLWDIRNNLLHFGGSSPKASDACCELLAKAFEIELRRLSSGRLAQEWAAKARKRKSMNEVVPSAFHGGSSAEVIWWNGESENYDYLGNEFLLWLWWRWETQSDTFELPDGSEVTGMFANTLSLECPLGESGKGTITAEGPTELPEAVQAIRSGKLPRKAGLILVRNGEQYEFTLQAETLAVGGAKIHNDDEPSEGRGILEDRIEKLRDLNGTLDLTFHTFCERRIGGDWPSELKEMRRWLKKK